MAKPEFGPYTTTVVEKLDSPVMRRTTKEGSYSGVGISSDNWDWDFSKYEMVEKKKAYRAMAGTDRAIPSRVANRAVEIPEASWLAWGVAPAVAITRKLRIMP